MITDAQIHAAIDSHEKTDSIFGAWYECNSCKERFLTPAFTEYTVAYQGGATAHKVYGCRRCSRAR